MGVFRFLSDKLVNFVANLGTERDKAAGSFYAPVCLTDEQLINAYAATRIADDQVAIAGLDFAPDLSGARPAPDVLFGAIHPVIVTSVDPKGLENAQAKGVNYDERVYQFDDATADN